jgi:hypothetical protein
VVVVDRVVGVVGVVAGATVTAGPAAGDDGARTGAGATGTGIGIGAAAATGATEKAGTVGA